MRWDELFSDLEAQLEAADAAELATEVAERTRGEAAALSLGDRLRPAVGSDIRLAVQGPGMINGRLEQLSVDSVLIREVGGRSALVPLASVLSVGGLFARSGVPGPQGQVFERLGLSVAVRGLARDRACLQIVLRDGASFTGTVDRVGRDFFEVAEHAPGEPRRATQLTGVRVVVLAAVGAFFSC